MAALLGALSFPLFTRKQHKASMKKYIRRIVSIHSSGNVALQNGRYVTAEQLEKRHKQALKAVANF